MFEKVCRTPPILPLRGVLQLATAIPNAAAGAILGMSYQPLGA